MVAHLKKIMQIKFKFFGQVHQYHWTITTINIVWWEFAGDKIPVDHSDDDDENNDDENDDDDQNDDDQNNDDDYNDLKSKLTQSYVCVHQDILFSSILLGQ